MTTTSPLDARSVPAVRQDQHLPQVAAERMAPHALRQRFLSPPVWRPELVREQKWGNRVMADAAVLVAVVTHAQPTVLLTQRSAHLSTHSGQVAFPGGKVDAGDASAVMAALREAHEEVGLPPNEVDVLGTLPTYTTGSSFQITPVVGLVKPGYTLAPNPHEVDAAFEVPLDFLMNPAHHRLHRWHYEGLEREWYSMPYQAVDREWFIWGATAGMLRNLYRMLSA